MRRRHVPWELCAGRLAALMAAELQIVHLPNIRPRVMRDIGSGQFGLSPTIDDTVTFSYPTRRWNVRTGHCSCHDEWNPLVSKTHEVRSDMSFAIHIASERRLVLFPQGQPEVKEHRDRCAEFAFWCGGDVGRFIDAPIQSIDAFAEYLRRIRGVRGEQTLVVLTCTNPLALAVVTLRRRLENHFPELRAARWMIYLDCERDPFFEAMALRSGHLTGELAEAPIWVGPQDSPYVVMWSEIRNRRVVEASIEQLDDLVLAASGEWPRQD